MVWGKVHDRHRFAPYVVFIDFHPDTIAGLKRLTNINGDFYILSDGFYMLPLPPRRSLNLRPGPVGMAAVCWKSKVVRCGVPGPA